MLGHHRCSGAPLLPAPPIMLFPLMALTVIPHLAILYSYASHAAGWYQRALW